MAIFAAPPCGTASRARERPLKSFAKRGFRIPQPLRSDAFPDMLPHISGKDRAKVELANQLYDQLADIFLHALSLELLCVIENPGNSLYWATSFFKRIHAAFPGFWTSFDHCCHGGDRPKRTSLWCNKDGVLNHLQVFCDNSHPHKAWLPRVASRNLRFVTGEEAAYPSLLAQRIMLSFLQHRPQGILRDATLQQQVAAAASTATRISLGVQPRGNKLKPLVAEFGHYLCTCSPARDKCLVGKFFGQHAQRQQSNFTSDF